MDFVLKPSQQRRWQSVNVWDGTHSRDTSSCSQRRKTNFYNWHCWCNMNIHFSFWITNESSSPHLNETSSPCVSPGGWTGLVKTLDFIGKGFHSHSCLKYSPAGKCSSGKQAVIWPTAPLCWGSAELVLYQGWLAGGSVIPSNLPWMTLIFFFMDSVLFASCWGVWVSLSLILFHKSLLSPAEDERIERYNEEQENDRLSDYKRRDQNNRGTIEWCCVCR